MSDGFAQRSLRHPARMAAGMELVMTAFLVGCCLVVVMRSPPMQQSTAGAVQMLPQPGQRCDYGQQPHYFLQVGVASQAGEVPAGYKAENWLHANPRVYPGLQGTGIHRPSHRCRLRFRPPEDMLGCSCLAQHHANATNTTVGRWGYHAWDESCQPDNVVEYLAGAGGRGGAEGPARDGKLRMLLLGHR